MTDPNPMTETVSVTLTLADVSLLSSMVAYFHEIGFGSDPTNAHPNAEDWHAIVRAMIFRVYPPMFVGELLTKLQEATPGFAEYRENQLRAAGMPPMNN